MSQENAFVRSLRRLWAVRHSLFLRRDELPVDAQASAVPLELALARAIDVDGRELAAFEAHRQDRPHLRLPDGGHSLR